jgi:integrase/recombinase XerC/integrase/recombinase XerD
MEEKANSLVIIPAHQGVITFSNIENFVADWLHLDVANGDACSDTLKTYRGHFEAWLTWCRDNRVHPGQATVEDIKGWRQDLITVGSKPSTISGEAELLFRAVPKDSEIKSLRDKAMIGLMALEGLRRVEIVRACVSDIGSDLEGLRLLVHGKGKERFIYPREDTARALQEYLTARGAVERDNQGEPLFVQVRKGGSAMGRISRTGVNKVVDYYLRKAGLKREGLSCHALRHTCGALLYQATRDVRAVQETLGHSNIATSAGYAHIIERGKARYTREIPVKIG